MHVIDIMQRVIEASISFSFYISHQNELNLYEMCAKMWILII